MIKIVLLIIGSIRSLAIAENAPPNTVSSSEPIIRTAVAVTLSPDGIAALVIKNASATSRRISATALDVDATCGFKVCAGLIQKISVDLAGINVPFLADEMSSISVIPAGSTPIQKVDEAAIPSICA